MSPFFIELARRLNLKGSGLILVYIAGIVTATLVLAIVEAARAAGQ